MKKRLSHIFSLLVLALGVFSLTLGCTACGDDDNNGSDKPVGALSTEQLSEKRDMSKSFKDGQFIVACGSSKTDQTKWSGKEFWLGALGTEDSDGLAIDPTGQISVAITERVKTVEDLLNIRIVFKEFNKEDFVLATQTNSFYADIVVTETFAIADMIPGGMFLDMNKIRTLNLADERWTEFNNQNLVEFADQIFGAYAGFASMTDEVYLLYYNKDIIKELGVEDPEQLYINGDWNADTFLSYCRAAKKDLNNDGIFDVNDRYGFTMGHRWDIAHVLYLGYGGDIMVEPDTFGDELVCALYDLTNHTETSSVALEAIDYVYKVMDPLDSLNVNSGYAIAAKPGDLTTCQLFTSGRALFYSYTRGRHYNDEIFKAENMHLGVVPIPRSHILDDGQYRCWVSWDSKMVGIPATSNENADNIAIVLEYLNYWSREENIIDRDQFIGQNFDWDSQETTTKIMEELPDYAVVDLAFIARRFTGGGNGFQTATDVVSYLCDPFPQGKGGRDNGIGAAAYITGQYYAIVDALEDFYEVIGAYRDAQRESVNKRYDQDVYDSWKDFQLQEYLSKHPSFDGEEEELEEEVQ